MALSAKAQERKNEVINWIRDNLDNPNLLHYSRMNTTRGKINIARLWMIGGLILTPEFGTPAQHILEDDDAWRIISRELKIHPSTFYKHLDTTNWNTAYNASRDSMKERFYRSRAYVGGTPYSFLRPELVEEFPAFPPITLANETTQGTYPMDAVLSMVGKIGGSATGDVKGDGILGFSNVKTLKSAVLKSGKVGESYLQSVEISKTGGNISFYWDAQEVFLDIVLTDDKATVEFTTDQVQDFLNDGTDLTFTAEVTAEDDSKQVYTWTVVDA